MDLIEQCKILAYEAGRCSGRSYPITAIIERAKGQLTLLNYAKPRWRIFLLRNDSISDANGCDCYLKPLNDAAYNIWSNAANNFWMYND